MYTVAAICIHLKKAHNLFRGEVLYSIIIELDALVDLVTLIKICLGEPSAKSYKWTTVLRFSIQDDL
jgi:hypothetical protein